MLSYKDNNLKIDISKTKYKLFAVNILKINNFGIIDDYICQMERGGKWFEIDHNKSKPINKPSYNCKSCDLYSFKNIFI